MSPSPIVTATSFTYATAVTSPSLVPIPALPTHVVIATLPTSYTAVTSPALLPIPTFCRRRFSPSPPHQRLLSPPPHEVSRCRHVTSACLDPLAPDSPSRHQCSSPSTPHLRLTSPSRQHRSSPFFLADACGHCHVSDIRYRRHVTNACSHPHNTDYHRKCHVTKI